MDPDAHKARALPRPSRTVLLAILLVSLAGVVQSLLVEPPTKQPRLFDERRYRLWATNLADRGFYGDEAGKWPADVELRTVGYSAYIPPGYPFFLAFFRKVVGSYRLVPFAQAVLVGATIAMASWIAFRVFGAVAAVSAGILLLATAVLATYSRLMLSEVFSTACLTAVIALALMAFDRRSWVLAVGTGAMLGVTALVRPQVLLLAIPLALWAFLAWRGRAAGTVAAVAIIGGLLIPVVPWIVRNEARLHRFVPISTYTWVNFFIVNNPGADGQFHLPEAFIGEERVREIRALSEVEQDDAWRRLSLAYVRGRPADAMRGWVRNGRIYLTEQDVVMDPYYGIRGQRAPRLDERVLELIAGAGLLVALGARWVSRRVWPVLIVAAYFISFFCFFLPEGRYRVPMLPMLAILGSAIPAAGWALVRRWRRTTAEDVE